MNLMDQDFDVTAPEEFPWGVLDSRVASAAGDRIAAIIREELRNPPEDRFRVPGLRRALVELAVTVETQRKAR